MKVPFVDLYEQYLTIKEEIDNAISTVIFNSDYIGGKYHKEFGKNFSELYGIKNFIGVANGTDAIYIILKMLGISQGDEVITVSNSWISTSETISQTGAVPVFVDIDPEYYTIDENKIREKISSKTKAIIPVHLYGQVCNIEAVKKICDEYNLFLIEDCAQSHFSEFNGKFAGTFGTAATFSFYPGKNLGAYGDAGGIITNDDELAQKCRMFANHGCLKKHHHEIEGINSRLDGIQAGILNVKLPHLKEWTDKRISNASKYSEYLNGVGDIIVPKVRPNSKHTFHLYVIRTKHRDSLQNFLNENGVSTAIHYPRILPSLPAYNYLNCNLEEFKISGQYQNEILSLPMFPELSSEQLEYVIQTIKKFFNN